MTTTKKRNYWAWAIPVSTLILGIALGTAAGGAVTATPAEPEVVTETVTETVVEEVEVIVVPEVCMTALDEGDELVNMHFDTMGMLMTLFDEIPDAMYAAYYADESGIQRMTGVIQDITADIDSLTARVNANNYHALASECRAAR